MKIELEKTGMIGGKELAVEVQYEADGYHASVYYDGKTINEIDAAGCNATCNPVPTPKDGAQMALDVVWQDAVEELTGLMTYWNLDAGVQF